MVEPKKSSATKKPNKAKDTATLRIPQKEGLTDAEMYAEVAMSPIIRNGSLACTFGNNMFTNNSEANAPDVNQSVKLLTDSCASVRKGSMDGITDMLTAQMATLDALFTLCAKRAANNMGQYPEAADRYMNMAFKAQAGCRTTAETLARIKRGGKQTVKVVHVHEGGQAVVADTVNNGMGGRTGANGENDEQPHGQGASVASLPSPDTERDIVPLSCLEGEEAVPAPRGA